MMDKERDEIRSVLQRHGCYGGEWFDLVEELRTIILRYAPDTVSCENGVNSESDPNQPAEHIILFL